MKKEVDKNQHLLDVYHVLDTLVLASCKLSHLVTARNSELGGVIVLILCVRNR